MTQEAGVPPEFWGRVEQIAAREVAKQARSGSTRNASITGGRYTIKGGALVVESADGAESVWFGPVTPTLPDGTYQPGMILWREDGSIALALYDPDPDPGGPGDYKQFLAIYDRAGNIVQSDDTDSGQGLARPFIGGGFARARFADWGVSTTSGTFETLWETRLYKQQPRLEVGYRASMDTAATTGEVRVLVDGVQLGATSSEAFAISTRIAGPGAIAGGHMQFVTVAIQARRTSASGALRVEPLYWTGRQS